MKNYILLLPFVLGSLINGCTSITQERPDLINSPELKIEKSVPLPDTLREISGMVLSGSTLIALNDGGNSEYLYTLDKESGMILSSHFTPGIRNNDWEELATFDGELFIGDFGNNGGSRKDLAIFRYPSGPLSDTLGVPERIEFNYALQDNFFPRYWMHQWDCEAMIVKDTIITLFSKNWKTQYVYQYNMPAKAGNYSLFPVDSLNLGILVTGAALDKETNRLAFCGYFAKEMYLVMLSDYSSRSYLDGDLTVYRLPELAGTQVESLVFLDGNILLASEATTIPQALYYVKLPEKGRKK